MHLYRIASSEHSPRIMHAFVRVHNFVILKEYAGLRIELGVCRPHTYVYVC